MGTTRGRCNYSFEVEVNMEAVIKAIIAKLGHGIDPDNFEFDGEILRMWGKENSRFEAWHCRATLESPVEDEFTLLDGIEENEVKDVVLDVFKNTNDIEVDVKIDEDNYEFPDEDY